MMLYGSNYVMWKLLGSKAYSNERNITYIIRKWRSNTLTMNILYYPINTGVYLHFYLSMF